MIKNEDDSEPSQVRINVNAFDLFFHFVLPNAVAD